MLRITSRHNPRLREALRLVASARDRRKAGRCVLEGEHLIEVYAQRIGAPETLVVAEPFLERAGVCALARRFDDRALVVPAPLFHEMAVLPAEVGVLAVVPAPRVPLSPGGAFCLLLDEVQDPGNVGSILRSAAAAGATDVYLSRGCAFAWAPKVLRAGMGGHFHLAIHEDVDLPAWAAQYRAGGGTLAAGVGRGGQDLYAAPMPRPLAIAVGNEGAGLSSALLAASSVRVSIPMPGGVESLNAAAAAAVLLFEAVRRVRAPA
ncbi:MAG: RNA methyltransferase [Betaproteobacteria bacterium]|nr:MAG: RNA methyltransferase [Betaproteobacteria bacterium]